MTTRIEIVPDPSQNTPDPQASAPLFRDGHFGGVGMSKPANKCANDDHRRATRMLGHCLTLAETDAWLGAIIVFRARLNAPERAALAFSALKSLDPADALKVAQAALSSGAGQPIAPLFGFMDEATFWSDQAEPQELAAYCLASFKNMAGDRQAAFLEFVNRRAA